MLMYEFLIFADLNFQEIQGFYESPIFKKLRHGQRNFEVQ